jgi:hypothetical protein
VKAENADEVKVVLRKRAVDETTFRCRGAQATAVFFFGFATHALLLGDLATFAIAGVIAALAAALGTRWRVLVRGKPPQ